MSSLFVAATPIGNLEDISLRTLRVLKQVDLILAEDTRKTKRLLERYNISTPLLSYHQHSKDDKMEKILRILRQGREMALVSDSGTPAISDPGGTLVQKIRQELKDKVKIVPLPGPCALIAALSIAGMRADKFLFLGFLPHKKGRNKLIAEAGASKYPAVLYESKHRIIKTLRQLKEQGVANVFVARELTKQFESAYQGRPEQVSQELQDKGEIKGEFVIIICQNSI